MLKLLGFTVSRVLALPQAATWAPGVRKAGESQGKPLRYGINPTLSRNFYAGNRQRDIHARGCFSQYVTLQFSMSFWEICWSC
jgi:hypothetical protein